MADEISDDHPDAPEPRPTRWSGGRGALVWALGLVATVGLVFLAAWTGLVLGVFGLGVVALVAGVALLAGASLGARRLMLPAAALALAVMLPAAAVQQIETRIDPSAGPLIAAPRTPSAVDPKGYVRGLGPILVDLRRFAAPDGSTTTIKARADSDHVVVALPRNQCFDLDVRYRVGDRWVSDARQATLKAVALVGGPHYASTSLAYNPMGLTKEGAEAAAKVGGERFGITADPKKPAPDSRLATSRLLAFGRNPAQPGHWHRNAPSPTAPRLRFDLQAGQQIVIRDYPSWAGPLDQETSGGWDQVSGMGWPNTVRAPLSPSERGWRMRAAVRTKLNRARWVKWEREIVDWGADQAARMAGPCASDAELRQRAYTFYTQPEAFRTSDGTVRRLIGGPTTRHSPIRPQPVANQSGFVFAVEVNGLGETRVVSEQSPSGIVLEPAFWEMQR